MAPPARERKKVLLKQINRSLRIRETDPDHVRFLRKDFAEQGQKKDLQVTEDLLLIGGHNSIEAMLSLGWTEAWASIIPGPLTERDIRLLAVLDNMGQKEMTPAEKFENYARIMEDFGISQAELSEKLGVPDYEISRYLSLKNAIEPVMGRLKAKTLQFTAAVEIARLKPELQQVALGRIDLMPKGPDDKQAKCDAIKRLVKALKAEGKTRRGPKPKGTRATIDVLELKSSSSDVQELLAADRKFRRALIWLKRNKLKATPENLAEALSRAAKKPGPDKAA